MTAPPDPMHVTPAARIMRLAASLDGACSRHFRHRAHPGVVDYPGDIIPYRLADSGRSSSALNSSSVIAAPG
jgi:hypothetical protein